MVYFKFFRRSLRIVLQLLLHGNGLQFKMPANQ